MIKLYELHWSHYCEKIRLALSYAQLPWQTCDIQAFSKKELLTYPSPPHMTRRTVPAIFDATFRAFLMDPTPILRYLCKNYPQVQTLYPRLQALFAQQRAVLAKHSQEGLSAYQVAIATVRQSRLPVRRCIRQSAALLPFPESESHAHNNQRTVWTWQTWLVPYRYLFPMRSGKGQQALASQGVR